MAELRAREELAIGDLREGRRLLCVIGPTAAGKSALSLQLCRMERTFEVISVDSRQVYRYMDIGTDKPSWEERREVPHHLLDVKDPDERYSVAEFCEEAKRTVERVFKRGKVPILVGGTPFYFYALFHRGLFEGPPGDEELRRALEEEAKAVGTAALHKRLSEVDPVAASRIHPNDLRRVIRALEVYALSGKPMSALWSSSVKPDLPSPFYLMVNRRREDLYGRIEKRARKQFEAGLLDEVKWLLERGFGRTSPPMCGLVYGEALEVLEGKLSFEEGIARATSRTKAFSRRQMTWFKRFPIGVEVDLTGCGEREVAEVAVRLLEQWYRGWGFKRR